MTPLPSIYYPDFIAANQAHAANPTPNPFPEPHPNPNPNPNPKP